MRSALFAGFLRFLVDSLRFLCLFGGVKQAMGSQQAQRIAVHSDECVNRAGSLMLMVHVNRRLCRKLLSVNTVAPRS